MVIVIAEAQRVVGGQPRSDLDRSLVLNAGAVGSDYLNWREQAAITPRRRQARPGQPGRIEEPINE
jgi:hypothetical protein